MEMLRRMKKGDIDAVVDIIDSHDDDDAADAREGFNRDGGIEDQFVHEQDGQIIGVTGFATPPGCDNTHWLSWTYIHADKVNQGIGRKMITEMIEFINQLGGRKLFIKVSDYAEENEDGQNVSIYAAALHLYKSLGFEEELVLPNYYDEGENLTILGLRFDPLSDNIPVAGIEKHKIQFNSIFEIAETDDSYSFGWDTKAKRLFDANDVKLGVDDVKNREGRAIFLSFPHNYANVAEVLHSAGFKNAGTLEDYFEDGIHEQHFSYYL